MKWKGFRLMVRVCVMLMGMCGSNQAKGVGGSNQANGVGGVPRSELVSMCHPPY